jgi:hypothetical protein
MVSFETLISQTLMGADRVAHRWSEILEFFAPGEKAKFDQAWTAKKFDAARWILRPIDLQTLRTLGSLNFRLSSS